MTDLCKNMINVGVGNNDYLVYWCQVCGALLVEDEEISFPEEGPGSAEFCEWSE